MVHTVKGFSIVNEADVFLEFPCFFYDPAAAAAKSLQSCLTPCDPIDDSPPGSTIPGIRQARTLEWVAIAFSDDPADVGNLISGSSAFSKSNLYIWKFSVHVLLKPRLKDFEHYFVSM